MQIRASRSRPATDRPPSQRRNAGSCGKALIANHRVVEWGRPPMPPICIRDYDDRYHSEADDLLFRELILPRLGHPYSPFGTGEECSMRVQRRNFPSEFWREATDRLADGGLSRASQDEAPPCLPLSTWFGGGERKEAVAGIRHQADSPNDRSSDLKLNPGRPCGDFQRRHSKPRAPDLRPGSTSWDLGRIARTGGYGFGDGFRLGMQSRPPPTRLPLRDRPDLTPRGERLGLMSRSLSEAPVPAHRALLRSAWVSGWRRGRTPP